MRDRKTGWPLPELMQDDCRGLSKFLSDPLAWRLRKGGVSITMKNRAEHLHWCKQRALAYVDAGDLHGAFASMASDLQKHPETAGHIGAVLGMAQLMGGLLDTPAEMRRYIEGFN